MCSGRLLRCSEWGRPTDDIFTYGVSPIPCECKVHRNSQVLVKHNGSKPTSTSVGSNSTLKPAQTCAGSQWSKCFLRYQPDLLNQKVLHRFQEIRTIMFSYVTLLKYIYIRYTAAVSPNMWGNVRGLCSFIKLLLQARLAPALWPLSTSTQQRRRVCRGDGLRFLWND